MHEALAEQLAKLLEQNETLLRENRLLQQKIQFLMQRLFGRSSEKLDRRQLNLLFGELNTLEPPPEDDPPPSPSGPRRAPRDAKPRLPENLPTEKIIVDPDEVKRDPNAYRLIGTEITEELDVIPVQYLRRLIIRRKFVSKADRTRPPLLVPLAPRLIEGSFASAGLLTDIVLRKYVDHLPLYRQEQILRTRHGIKLSRQTMSDWVRAVADWLSPIYAHIREDLQGGGYLQVDETPVRYCLAEGGGSAQGYFWVYHRPAPAGKPGGDVLFEWHTGRGADCLTTMLDPFRGKVQCDGYVAYSSYAKTHPGILLAGCWAHARRGFHEARDEAPGLARWLLNQIQHLYRVEAEARAARAGPRLRQAWRAARSRMILDRIERVLERKLVAHLPKSQMGQAIAYALGHWTKLLRFVDDGQIEIDNNLVENAIRPTAVGKKNWLFIGHPEAGDRSAILYTLLESCRRRGINPQEYLRDVLTRLPAMTNRQTRELTPVNWLADRKAQAA